MNKLNASKSMLVHSNETGGKEMHGSETEGKEMHGKRNRGQRNQGQGAVATTTTRRPRKGPLTSGVCYLWCMNRDLWCLNLDF